MENNVKVTIINKKTMSIEYSFDSVKEFIGYVNELYKMACKNFYDAAMVYMNDDRIVSPGLLIKKYEREY